VGTALLDRAREALRPHTRAHTRGSACGADGCMETTSGGKRYCLTHLFSQPYALAVRVTLHRLGELGPHERDVDEAPVREELRRQRRARVVPVE
jgi:hypothetical protein